jgi:hypothetical protein
MKNFPLLLTKKSFSSFKRTIRTNQARKTINEIIKSNRFKIKNVKIAEDKVAMRRNTMPINRSKLSFFPLILCIILSRFLKLK